MTTNITSTRAPAVMAALFDAINGWDGLNGCAVAYGPPREAIDEQIYFVGYTAESEWASLGNRARNEQFTIGAIISIRGGQTEGPASLERAHLIGAELESILRANTNLGVTGVIFMEAIPRRATIFPVPEGFGTELVYDIRVKARI